MLPLTRLRPKALCPVANVALVDLAIDRARAATPSVAVNVHAGRDQMVSHLDGRVHLSMEEREALGTAGGVGNLRHWVQGRDALILNADAWHHADLAAFAADWDRERIRIVVAGDASGGLTPGVQVCASFMPWADVGRLQPEPSGLYEVSWRAAASEGRVEVVGYGGPFVDCGTPASYLAANLAASGGASVIGPGAVVEGELERSVVWPDGVVRRGERLVRAIRAGPRLTLYAR
jgi:N-acetyl-alpha-D-muramate 1-phosphate uridylyltransferase